LKREKERRERGQKIDETVEERQRMQRKRDAEKIKREKAVSERALGLVFGARGSGGFGAQAEEAIHSSFFLFDIYISFDSFEFSEVLCK